MDEKRRPDVNMIHRPQHRSARTGVAVFFLLLIGLYTYRQLLPATKINPPTLSNRVASDGLTALVEGQRDVDIETGTVDPSAVTRRVPLEVHMISKCPDTRDALMELVLPAMPKVADKVDFRLSYIGRETSHDGVECKHGPAECLGNIVELCAQELYPDPKISLGFVWCLTKEYKLIPDRTLIEDCALEHAIDFDALNECATRDNGAHGMDLLRSSVARTAEAGITISATIRLDNEVYCVRDGGEWKDCPHGSGVNDLIVNIAKLAGRS